MIATPKEFSEPYQENFGATTSPGEVSKGRKAPPSVADYLGNISHVDHQVGRLVKALDELGVSDNTLGLFTSDNGPIPPGSTGGLRGGKGTLYEGGIREPGIIRWPAGIKPGQTCDTPVTGLDLLPTFCELAGVAAPSDRTIDGVSIAPLLEGREFTRNKPMFWWRLSGETVLREDDWKLRALTEPLARFPSRIDRIKKGKLQRFELINLADDPGEERNVAAQHPDRMERMTKHMRALHAEMQAAAEPWPERALPADKKKTKSGTE